MKINAMTFNIRCCNDPNGHSIAERAPRLKTILDRFDCDVIGFQEVTGVWMDYIPNDYQDTFDIYHQYRDSRLKEGLTILWKKERFEMIDKGCFWLSDTPEVESKGWDEVYDCYRICTYVVLKEKESGAHFTFMNTHFGFGDRCQTDSAKLLYEYSKKISDYPTVLVGDFNLYTTSVGYKKLTEYFVDTNAASVNEYSITFHDYFRHPEICGHIDFCFADDKVTPLNQVIVKDTINEKYPSDHYGVYTTVEI